VFDVLAKNTRIIRDQDGQRHFSKTHCIQCKGAAGKRRRQISESCLNQYG
jgi:hypothetical protein